MPTRSADARNRSVVRRAPPRVEELLFLVLPTPIGRLRLAASPTGLVRVQLPGAEAETRMSLWLALHFAGAAHRRGTNPVLRKAAREVEAYFTGALRSFTLPVELAGTAFQLAVWRHVADIPFGATRSYAAIARALGNPHATRAVGAAHAANPVPIVVPCHRVLGADGGLTGYACGVATKRWLLDHERERAGNRTAEPASPQLSLFTEKSVRRARHWPTAVPGRARSHPR